LASNIPPHLRFSFVLNGEIVSVENCPNLIDYTDKLEALTAHQHDSNSAASSATWLCQAMEGFKPQQIISATENVYHQKRANNSKARRPFFYAQMVELVGRLLEHGYEIWVVSASNVWSVRWMLCTVLNTLLKDKGFTGTIKPENVIGMSPLIKGSDNRYYKDRFLVNANARYANLCPEELDTFTLSTQLTLPAAEHFGKVANIMQWVKKKPYLVAGDSPNDLPMLCHGEHALWVAKLDYPKAQQLMVQTMVNQASKLFVQPTLLDGSHGFVESREKLHSLTRNDSVVVNDSMNILNDWLSPF